MQEYIVYAILLLSVIYLARKVYRNMSGKGSSCGSCSGCPSQTGKDCPSAKKKKK